MKALIIIVAICGIVCLGTIAATLNYNLIKKTSLINEQIKSIALQNDETVKQARMIVDQYNKQRQRQMQEQNK